MKLRRETRDVGLSESIKLIVRYLGSPTMALLLSKGKRVLLRLARNPRVSRAGLVQARQYLEFPQREKGKHFKRACKTE